METTKAPRTAIFNLSALCSQEHFVGCAKTTSIEQAVFCGARARLLPLRLCTKQIKEASKQANINKQTKMLQWTGSGHQGAEHTDDARAANLKTQTRQQRKQKQK
jgi:hypothetical protein